MLRVGEATAQFQAGGERVPGFGPQLVARYAALGLGAPLVVVIPDVLVAPVVSEKSYSLLDEGKYTFVVDPRANKTEIRIAVEKVFGVTVASVNTINRKGKARRTRFGMGRRKDTKRAVVTLREGTIDIFGGPVS